MFYLSVVVKLTVSWSVYTRTLNKEFPVQEIWTLRDTMRSSEEKHCSSVFRGTT